MMVWKRISAYTVINDLIFMIAFRSQVKQQGFRLLCGGFEREWHNASQAILLWNAQKLDVGVFTLWMSKISIHEKCRKKI